MEPLEALAIGFMFGVVMILQVVIIWRTIATAIGSVPPRRRPGRHPAREEPYMPVGRALDDEPAVFEADEGEEETLADLAVRSRAGTNRFLGEPR